MMRLVTMVARVCLGVYKKMDAAAAARERYTVEAELADGPGSPRVILMHDYETGMTAAVAPSEGGELTSLRVRFRHLPVKLIYSAREYASDQGFRGKAPASDWVARPSHRSSGTHPRCLPSRSHA